MQRAVLARSVFAGRVAARRRFSTSFYDSQSGRTVTVPTGPQVHLTLNTVAADRVPSALKHLLRGDGTPTRGLASVDHDFIDVADPVEGVSAVAVARDAGAIPRARLLPELCTDPHDLQLRAAELADAGAETILLSVASSCTEDELRELAESAFEIDVVGVPMLARLGLCVEPGKDTQGALALAKWAHEELGLLHYMSCLAGKQGASCSAVRAA